MRKGTVFTVLLLVFIFLLGGSELAMTSEKGSVAVLQNIDGEQLKLWLAENKDLTIVDVREPYEFAGGHIPSAKLVPLGQLSARASELDTEKPIVLVCYSGSRSQRCGETLLAMGFTNVFNLLGGMSGWTGPVEK